MLSLVSLSLSTVIFPRGTRKIKKRMLGTPGSRIVFVPLKELNWWQEHSFLSTPQWLYPVV